MRYVFILCLFATPAFAQQQVTIEQRLGATIGALIVENTRLAIELENAKQTIVKLQAEAKEKEKEKEKEK